MLEDVPETQMKQSKDVTQTRLGQQQCPSHEECTRSGDLEGMFELDTGGLDSRNDRGMPLVQAQGDSRRQRS